MAIQCKLNLSNNNFIHKGNGVISATTNTTAEDKTTTYTISYGSITSNTCQLTQEHATPSAPTSGVSYDVTVYPNETDEWCIEVRNYTTRPINFRIEYNVTLRDSTVIPQDMSFNNVGGGEVKTTATGYDESQASEPILTNPLTCAEWAD